MKKFITFILLSLLFSACTPTAKVPVNKYNITAVEAKDMYISASKEEQDIYIAVGSKVFQNVSDETLIEYFKAISITMSNTATAAEKAKADAKFNAILPKALQEGMLAKNSIDKLALCNKTQLVEDWSLLISKGEEKDFFTELFSLPTHRSACVIRFVAKIISKKSERELATK
ncbi:MAG: hypothetical protein LN573_03505 [Rickettsia endosymbiont of Oxypoda opaca]|nr:hypothetical protein [Rickettsia endosymbiont of Oxypoda opaca]